MAASGDVLVSGGRHPAGAPPSTGVSEVRSPTLGRLQGPGRSQGPRGPSRWGLSPPQFFVLLLLVFLLEATITILFFAYTDKVGHLLPPSVLTTQRGPWHRG